MVVTVSVSESVDLFMQRAGDEYEDPEIRAACILAAHTLKALVSKNKKFYNKKVDIKVELKEEGERNEDNNSI